MEDARRRILLSSFASALCGLFVAPSSASADELTLTSVDPGPPQEICDYTAHAPVGHSAPVNCGESKDTGYTSGKAFPITVVHVDNKPVEKDTANAYWVMRKAAAADGVDMHIVSGFRTYAEQQYLYNCFVNCNCNNCNLAAKPGYSNHQSGHALDLNASAPGVYNWLDKHGGAYGFSETVPGENWHWEWWGGGPGGGICDITVPPKGAVDQADCGIVRGWAQDPDHPDTPISVHVYFGGPASDPDAVSVSVLADDYREDLCGALGSCEHAFELAYPLSMMDGEPHPVHVYAIDKDGDGNPQIGVNKAVSCAAPPLPAGVRRHIPTSAALNAWRFDLFWDQYRVDDATLISLPEWIAIEPAPVLVTTAEEPSPGIWVLDAGVRRHIPNPATAAAWDLELDSALVLDAASFDAIEEGTALRPRPLMVKGTGSAVYLIDDRQGSPLEPDDGFDVTSGSDGGGDSEDSDGQDSDSDASAGSSSGSDPSSSGGASDGTSDGTSIGTSDSDHDSGGLGEASDGEGCGCRSTPGDAEWAYLLLLLAALGRRRRRPLLLAPLTVTVATVATVATAGCYTSPADDDTAASDTFDGSTADASSSSSSTSTSTGAPDGADCDDPPTWYADDDGDGYGRQDRSTRACEAPEGYVDNAGDCDDQRANVNPGALEDCNGRDDDCDQLRDEASSINAVCGACWLFTGEDEHTYWVCEVPVPWEEAEARCQAFGATLVSVQSDEENQLLHEYADKGVSLHLGLNDRAVEGEFVWSDGSPVDYTHWTAGEPNDSKEAEDCAELRSKTGLWNDISCENARYFACEAESR